ncbi:MAG: hypothetical protein K2O18_09165 [Oscillospiraceae bacterium]|nr:hypothetical protein [Oscillospiraceae bacterium]
MSCMIMKRESLAALANAVETRLNCDYGFWGFEAPDNLYRELQDCKPDHFYYDAKSIYRKLYAINVRAYNGRYASHEESAGEEAPEVDIACYTVHRRPEYRNHGFAVCPWHYQLAKLLDFWLYQTAEDATYSDPLRLAMKEFRDDLYQFIVQNSPQYIVGRWGELPPAPQTVKEGYSRTKEAEPLILEPEDWQPDEWATLCKLAGGLPPQDTERIVISDHTLETYITKKGSHNEGGAN